MMRIFINELTEGYLPVIQAGLEWIDLKSQVKSGDCVFIKPNLTFPHFRKGVMTNPDCVEALIIALKDYTDNIIVGEADGGGYNRFDMDNVFEQIGLVNTAQKYGVKLVNLSKLPHRNLDFTYRRKNLQVPIPQLLFDEVNLFISLPVPKIHMYTYMSMAIKNLWGCIKEPKYRVKLHPYLEEVLWKITEEFPPSLAVVDGRYGLDRSGPMRGDVVNLNWLMIANNLYAADIAGCHLMQLDPDKVYYIRHICQRANIAPDISKIKFNRNVEEFIGPKFKLERHWIDSLSTLAFRIPWINHIAYYSALSNLLHRIIYLFREPFYDYDNPEET